LAVSLEGNLTPLESGKSRIVVYRNDIPIGLFALAVKPSLKLDGEEVGVCDRGRKLMLDLNPGTYELSMQTDIIAKVAIDVKADSTTFVSCGMLPIGLLLPAPFLNVVEKEDVPERVASLSVQQVN
jgi:hypothetical protein